ncbi:hypothetical protein CcCBS67573_g06404 [Chytriomyces confervae]|uniref:Uncharacterized protein n=1 Tax=Chytriomyces confervae TaxID=246404 RepID=A0A507F5U6_9FUNG|nr:hypothetical protein CcCBS67573_g06404 [Chytriomyces confervae]
MSPRVPALVHTFESLATGEAATPTSVFYGYASIDVAGDLFATVVAVVSCWIDRSTRLSKVLMAENVARSGISLVQSVVYIWASQDLSTFTFANGIQMVVIALLLNSEFMLIEARSAAYLESKHGPTKKKRFKLPSPSPLTPISMSAPLGPGKEVFASDASLRPTEISVSVIVACAVYGFAWLVSLVLVTVYTQRESVALKRDIAALKERLLVKAHEDGIRPAATAVTQQQPSAIEPAHPHLEREVSARRSTAAPLRINISTNSANNGHHSALQTGLNDISMHPINSQKVFFNDGDNEDDDDAALVVPSTPETNKLILALANGDDVHDSFFEFDASQPPSIHEDSDAKRFSAINNNKNPNKTTSGLRKSDSNNSIGSSNRNELSVAGGGARVGVATSAKYLSADTLPSISRRGSTSAPESVIFVPSHTISRPNLLLRASALPHNPNLWRRMFSISSPKFLPEDIDIASKYAPGSAARARFVEPLPPVTPLAQRVHRLILAAIDADLKVLESRFKKDAVRYPPVMYTFIGFQLLAVFLFVFGQGLSGWPAGLPTFCLVVGVTLGFEVLASVLIRDLLTDLKAERACLILSLRRVQARAPYSLQFTATTYSYRMKPFEYIWIPFVFLFSWWAVPLARRAFGDAEKVYVKGPPKSEGGGVFGGIEDSGAAEAAASGGACIVLNGRLRPTVWNVSALLRMPAGGDDEVVEKGPRMGSQETAVDVRA